MFGPLLGGVITTYASWRWIFFVNLPIGLLGMVLALRYVEDGGEELAVPFDVLGFLMVGLGAALLQFGIENIGRPIVPVSIIVAVLLAALLLLLGFARYARTRVAPAVDLGLFRLRSFAVGTLAGGLCRIAFNAPPFLLPLMLQVGFGMSPMVSGSLTFLGSAGAFFIRVLSKHLLRLFGFGAVLIGSAVAGSMALVGFTLLEPQTPRLAIAALVFVFGLIRATQFMTSNTLSYADMPGARLSRATSLGGVLQQLTVSFGVSLSAMVLGLVTAPGEALTPARFHVVFLAMAVLPLLAIPGFLRLKAEDGAQVSGYGGR